MNTKYIAVFSILLLFSGVFAITGATVTSVANLTRWDATLAGNLTTEGGNISAVNLSSNALTDRWAGLFGNTSGSIYLTDNESGATNYMYMWSTTPGSDGEVCVSVNNNFPFANFASADLTNLNTAFNLGSAADNATNTFTATNCTLDFSGVVVNNIANAETGNHASDTFYTCAIQSGAGTAKGDFAFCTHINGSGVNYRGDSADYEVMVPTQPGTGTETYYFYMEFN